MSVVRISTKGQLVIPREIRERCGLRAGDRFAVSEEAGVITLTPLERHPVLELRGTLGALPDLTDALHKERAVDQARTDPPHG